jgi:hypothetical protein
VIQQRGDFVKNTVTATASRKTTLKTRAARPAPRTVIDRITIPWLEAIDPVAAVRGMSSGFTVMILGSLLAPMIAIHVPVIGPLALALAAIVAFVVAATKQGRSEAPVVQGMTAALGTYFLVLPVVYMTTHTWDLLQIGTTTATALVFGGISGAVTARFAPHGGRR